MSNKTKTISLILSFIMVFSVFGVVPFGVSAQSDLAQTGVESGKTGNCQWVLDDDGVLTISGEGIMGDYEYSSPAPWRYLDVTKVIIEDGVTSIGSYAFGCQYGLETVVIGNSVDTIEDSAFAYCDMLKNITLPDSVTSIGKYAFSDCEQLTRINIPDGVTNVGYQAFWNCNRIKSVSLPAGIKIIGNEAFGYYEDDDYQLTKVYGFTVYGYKNSVAEFYANIHDCTFISRGRVTSGTTGGCTWELSGTELTISGNGKMADFSYNYSYWGKDITKLTITEGVTAIGKYCFDGCKDLTNVNIGSSVTEIRAYAFRNCTSLKSLNLPASVTSISSDFFDGYAFYGCNALTSITVDAGNTSYDSRQNCNAIINSESNSLILGCQNTTIPDSVVEIGDYAFYGCNSLTKMTIPSSVTEIKGRAFKDCSNLKTVTIPASVTGIGDEAFGYYLQKIYDSYGEVIDSDLMKVSGFTIFGKRDTVAERYARENGFTFIELGDIPVGSKLGDADGDGEVTSIDVTQIQRADALFDTGIDEDTLMNGDVDGNGFLDIVDATWIQRWLALMDVPFEIGKAK